MVLPGLGSLTSDDAEAASTLAILGAVPRVKRVPKQRSQDRPSEARAQNAPQPQRAFSPGDKVLDHQTARVAEVISVTSSHAKVVFSCGRTQVLDLRRLEISDLDPSVKGFEVLHKR